MRHWKKAISMLLVLVLLLGMCVTASAEDATGSITIKNAVKDQTYTIYQILTLESYDKDRGAYAYKAANDTWATFLKSEAIAGVYVNTDTSGYVTWVEKADAAAFAKLAQAYAAKNTITNQGKKTADAATLGEGTELKFENLKLGYYLVDSTLGTLCSLDTTNPNVEMREKNAVPENVKEVEEDSTNSYGAKNDADMQQTVNFRSTITAQAGAENYVFHDKMSAGLTFGSVTGVTLNTTKVDAANYEIVTSGLDDGCTFEVRFQQAFCDTLKASDKIVISYTATLNENAVVAGSGNPNESWLEYGQTGSTSTTPVSTTTTYTWCVNIFKYTNGAGDQKTGLAGAEFVLYKKTDNKTYYATAEKTTGEATDTYKVTGWTETKASATKFISPASGKFTINGLDSDTYYLEEIMPPAGFNALSEPITITISDTGKVNATEANANGVDEVEILNQTGTELPETGGMGTMLFYVVGGILVLCAIVLLVTKKRMRNADR